MLFARGFFNTIQQKFEGATQQQQPDGKRKRHVNNKEVQFRKEQMCMEKGENTDAGELKKKFSSESTENRNQKAQAWHAEIKQQ